MGAIPDEGTPVAAIAARQGRLPGEGPDAEPPGATCTTGEFARDQYLGYGLSRMRIRILPGTPKLFRRRVFWVQ